MSGEKGGEGSAGVIPLQERAKVLIIQVDVSVVEWQITHSQKHAP